jgi:branched chain amino acid efflux pump
MPLLAVIALAAGTYAYRVAGPLLRHRLRLPEALSRLLETAATILLFALVAISALVDGAGFAGWARPAGVLVGGVLAIRRAPFPLVVAAAAGTTAVLRACGMA